MLPFGKNINNEVITKKSVSFSYFFSGTEPYKCAEAKLPTSEQVLTGNNSRVYFFNPNYFSLATFLIRILFSYAEKDN